MHQHEAATADIAGLRMCHGEREADRHRGVDRIAARLQDLHADMRGKLLLRHHHAVARHHGKRARHVGDDRRRRGRCDLRQGGWRGCHACRKTNDLSNPEESRHRLLLAHHAM
jgi:hypothetical protein